jgi:hypothetical protein
MVWIVFSIFILIVNKKQWLRLLNAYYLKIAVFSFLQLTNLKFKWFKYTASMFMAFVGLAFIILLPLGYVFLIKTKDLNDKYIKANFGAVYESYKQEHFKTAAFEVVVLTKKFLTAFSIVFFGFSPHF